MPSSHFRQRQDKPVLSYLVGVHGVNWIGDKSRLSATENFETVLSNLEMWCYLSLVLSWPSFQFVTCTVSYCDVIFGNWVKTSSQMRSHRRQNCSLSNILKTVCDCRELSSHRRQDMTIRQSLSCRCRRCELGISVSFVIRAHIRFLRKSTVRLTWMRYVMSVPLLCCCDAYNVAWWSWYKITYPAAALSACPIACHTCGLCKKLNICTTQ